MDWRLALWSDRSLLGVGTIYQYQRNGRIQEGRNDIILWIKTVGDLLRAVHARKDHWLRCTSRRGAADARSSQSGGTQLALMTVRVLDLARIERLVANVGGGFQYGQLGSAAAFPGARTSAPVGANGRRGRSRPSRAGGYSREARTEQRSVEYSWYWEIALLVTDRN